ncbi:uncharacterized protein N7484_004985 [Penicillium longicatenatum]|uniref:uncharacterized protein n=1 Tax=Penicillium longicatenatum TaxID=1561947 RepID=UPI002546BEE6|nr:uncharacterized protein N7484_004985 [Penicillium longicatenatum]KAJ5651262.1 hypothetical protein N7484_004985 [Penicillium longicatenatum]
MSYDQITKYLRTLPIRLPQTQQERFALALGTTAAIGTSLILPTLYRDYRIFRSYGAGGVPSNVFGWLIVRAIFQPFMGEMFGTEIYVQRVHALEGHGAGEAGFLTLAPEQVRSGERPVVGPHAAPQRQLTQLPDEEIKDKLQAAFKAFGHRNHHLVKFQRSGQEAHADALFLSNHLPASDVVKTTHGELAHLHANGDFSGHMLLAPADCMKAIEAGWGQRHGFSGRRALSVLSFGTMYDLPAEFLLIYAPRNDAEIATFMQIVEAGIKYTTGREDVR